VYSMQVEVPSEMLGAAINFLQSGAEVPLNYSSAR
jgi:hypothetical protein